jgi:hypothetical protein
MSKLAIAALAVAMASSAPAYAQTATGQGAAYNNFVPATGTGTFGNNGPLAGLFTNVFTFNVTSRGILASDFSNAASANGGASDIDFSSATLTGNGTTATYTKLIGEPVTLTELWGISPILLSAGTYTLTIAGRSFGNTATFAGNFNVSAVPEPAAWAMMIGGIGMVGGALRRRKVTTKVSFA